LDAAAFHRNHGVIGDTINGLLSEPAGQVIEIGSGTGQHVIAFARAMPRYGWWPSDRSRSHLDSIEAWRRHSGALNVAKPFELDASASDWGFGRPGMPATEGIVAVVCVNVLHIAPWSVAEGVMRGAGCYLPGGAHLIVYGPFRRDGRHTAESNVRFDAALRRQDPSWGVRDSADLDACGRRHDLALAQVLPMPANNFVLCFTKSPR
jgi:hypothetical protein